MPITKLRFNNVGPFDDVEFEFDSRVNVFTGPNNSGKSTVLMVLAALFVLPFTLPAKLLRPSGPPATAWTVGFRPSNEERANFSERGVFPRSFWDGDLKSMLRLVRTVGYTVFVPALRWSSDFRAESPLPKKPDSSPVQSATGGAPQYSDSQKEYLTEWAKWNKLAVPSASLVSDQAIIQKIIELDYMAYRRHQPSVRNVIDKIATVASEITEGFDVRFVGIGEDAQGLFPEFKTPDGVVPLNVMSQGTQSILQWVAHLLLGFAEYYDYPSNLEDKSGILIIDEIDAHLHPSWQRRIIPTLVKHFPNLQIFCSTHSPLMLAGLKQGQVHLLKRDEEGKVTVSRNETDIIGWSADEILRNLLDVPGPTDLATVRHLERLQELRDKEKLSVKEAEELEQLRDMVHQTLLGGPITAQVEQLTALLKESKADFGSRADASAPTKARTTRRRRNPAE